MSWKFLGGVLLALLVTMTAAAQPGTADVPAPLQPWVPWVLDGKQDALCPQVAGKAVCSWPSALSLDLAEDGGRFSMTVYQEHAGAVALPGDARRYPQDVTLDGRPAVVLDGAMVNVPQGAHRVAGRFEWPRLPESLATPVDLGTLTLTVAGKAVAYPRREASGMLWLQSTAAQEDATQRLAILVSRRIDDGVPMRITTRLDITVGGKARELLLQGAVLGETRPVQLKSEIPARLEADGALRLQVSAGQHRVEVIAVAPTPPAALSMPALAEPWPQQEIWVFAPAPSLRQVELSGAPQIDPERTNLDADFRGLSTYVLSADQSLKFDTRRRGDAAPPPNELRISREMWLDLDGEAFTVRDHLNGIFQQGFRLNLLQGKLGRVQMGGADQLLTTLDGKAGIEVREKNVSASAEWRLDSEDGQIPAVAWSEDATNVSTTLHLPPGYTLLDVGGADSVSGTLLSRWDLWDFFFVLLIALGTAKLAGVLYFPVALVALSLSHHVGGAPGISLLWLLLALALTRVELSGWPAFAARAALWASLAGLLVVLVPFAVSEVRSALYPQLSSVGGSTEHDAPDWLLGAASAPHRDEAAPMEMPQSEVWEEEATAAANEPSPRAGGGGVKKRQVRLSGSLDLSGSSMFDKDRYGAGSAAAVQTGPGIPSWGHDTYRVHFSGPVQRDASLHLYILSQGVGRLLSVLRVVFFGVLLFGLLRGRSLGLPKPPAERTLAAAAACLLFVALQGELAHAQPGGLADVLAPAEEPKEAPRDSILSELQQRLLKPPACAPRCVSVSRLALAVENAEVTVEAQVHAGAVASYRVPGPLAIWTPRSIEVDGRPAMAAVRADSGSLFLRVEPGVHRIVLRGPLQDPSGVLLHLGTPPHRVSLRAPNFEADGLREDGSATETLQLRRKVDEKAPGAVETKALPPFVEVTRHYELGVDFRLHTRLVRLGQLGVPLVVRFPLLSGESVNSADVEVEQGSAVIHFPADQQEVAFESSLSPRERVALVAPKVSAQQPFTATWEILCSPLYHCETEGLAPVARQIAGRVGYRFKPYPGERVALSLTRLPPAEGAATTIDHASLNYRPGSRLTLATLSLSVRSSAGAVVRIGLPDRARPMAVTVDGAAVPTRTEGDALELALPPGARSGVVEFQVDVGMDNAFSTPVVTIDGELVNVELSVDVPPSRWLLWTAGPQWGPAVLFWGHLVVVLLAALLLGRVANSPLRTRQWLLLGLGLSQVPTPAALTVVAWFFVMHFRARWTPPGHFRFNLLQLLLIGLTFAAAGVLGEAVHRGLVVQPNMQVAGYHSYNASLVWYVDRVVDAFPRATVISVPLWIYKGLMLAWALWLAASALSFLRFGWDAFSSGGRFRSLRASRLWPGNRKQAEQGAGPPTA